MLCEKYGCRVVAFIGACFSCTGIVISTFATRVFHLYVSYAFVGGLGFGLMFLPANVCVVQHFEKHRALANGISVCGSGVGTFVLNYFIRILIDNYGWRGTILLEAGFSLQCAVFGLLLLSPMKSKTPAELEVYDNPVCESQNDTCIHTTPTCTQIGCDPVVTSSTNISQHVNIDSNDKNGISKTIENNTSISSITVVNNVEPHAKRCNGWISCNLFEDNTLLKDPRFLFMLLSSFIVALAITIPFNFTADLAVESGMTKYQASLLTSCTGIASTIGRVLFGWLADRRCINKMVLTAVLLILAGAATALSSLLTRFSTRMIYNFLFGLFTGGYITQLNVVSAELFGTERVGKVLGMSLFTAGVGIIISSPIGGLLYDMTGNYDATFVVAGSEFVVGGLLFLVIKFYADRRCLPAVD